MKRRPHISKRTDTLVPCATLFRSGRYEHVADGQRGVDDVQRAAVPPVHQSRRIPSRSSRRYRASRDSPSSAAACPTTPWLCSSASSVAPRSCPSAVATPPADPGFGLPPRLGASHEHGQPPGGEK